MGTANKVQGGMGAQYVVFVNIFNGLAIPRIDFSRRIFDESRKDVKN